MTNSSSYIRTIFLGCCLFIAHTVTAQQAITTFILVRHAEKAMGDSKDPELTEAGQARAHRLISMLERTSIDAVYSTSYKRTRDTVTPLAHAKGLTVQDYEPQKEAAVEKMLKDHVGKTILVSGHSNTIPQIAGWLTGSDNWEAFDESDYGNVLIVSVVERRKVTTVTWLRY